MEGPIPPGQERPLPQLAHPQPRLSRAAGNQLISSVHLFPNAFPCPSSRFFIRRALGALTGLCLLAGGVSIAQTQLPGSTGKGPVGWDSYRRPDLFPKLRSGTETREFSSTGPAQANGDFNHPLRVTSDGQYVIAEANGAGEIVSIWSTINGGDVTNDGLITIELDGHVVLSTNYQALVSGALGAPWVWPLVGNLYDTSGGAQIKVPMPYTQSMRVIRTLKIQVQSQSWSRPDPQFNSINLSWEPDTDSVGVVSYQIYGSMDAAVPVNSTTLVGQSPVPGFQHAGLGLEQQWHYRVRAIDGAGHLGPISDVVSARTGNELKIEGESLVATATGTAPVVIQGNCCGVIWSGNA
jgi:hypothetical protein